MKRPVFTNRCRGRRAFTLVELAIVVAVIGILAAIAVPRFTSAGGRYRAELAADRVMRDILYARQCAMTRSAPQTITFDAAGRAYEIGGMADPDTPDLKFSVALGAAPYRASSLAADFGGSATLTFNGFGIPASAGTVTVRADGFSCTVSVAAKTGVASRAPVTSP